jgi:hypothetical protein
MGMHRKRVVSWDYLPLEDSMFVRVVLVLVIAGVPLAAQQEEHPKVPKDSIMAVVTGCLKGRVINASDVRQTDTTSGYNIRSHAFRLAGKKDVMGQVKEYDGERVEITGLIKKSALIEPGIKFKGGRVMIGGGTRDGSTSSLPDPAENVVVFDTLAVTRLGGSCGS